MARRARGREEGAVLNDGYTYRERIARRSAGQRLDRYLSATYSHSTAAQWTAHIAAGRVLLDGVAAGGGSLLVAGQALEWRRPAWDEPPAPLACPVLLDAGAVQVVHKPAGLPTLPGGGFLQHTLLHQLRLLDPRLSPAHRLGRWTSGAVLCTRTAPAAAHLADQFASRAIGKRYRALASGSPTEDRFEVTVPIGPVPYPSLGTLHAASAGGRASASSVTVLERRAGAFLCDVAIASGRPHQIRIHLAAAGHPLVGDPLYAPGGLPIAGGTARPGDPGYQLHAAELRFVHPETGEPVQVDAPPPPGLERG